MGFTMPIFISGLGFANNPEAFVTAKTTILLASLIAVAFPKAGFMGLCHCAPRQKYAVFCRTGVKNEPCPILIKQKTELLEVELPALHLVRPISSR